MVAYDFLFNSLELYRFYYIELSVSIAFSSFV